MEDFHKFPIIKSRTTDNKFHGSSSRGDGYCSIWSVIIGKSLIDKKIFRYDEQNLKIKSINDIIKNILLITDNFIEIIKEQPNDVDNFNINESININLFELQLLKDQLEKPFENISTIEGVAHFKILALIMHVNILVEDTTINKIFSFNHLYLRSIRISTNNCHYHVRNSTKSDQVNFKNIFWWDHMWSWIPYPPLAEGEKLIPIIE